LPDVIFNNDGDCPANIYWDNGSSEIFYATTKGGQSFTVQSYPGHMWRVRNVNDNSLIRSYTVSSDCADQHVNFSSTSCVASCPENELSNAGFESGSTGYTLSSYAAISSDFINSGSKSLKLNRAGSSAHRVIAIGGNQEFSLSAYVRTTSPGGINSIGVEFLNIGGGVVSSASSGDLPNTNGHFQQFFVSGITLLIPSLTYTLTTSVFRSAAR